MACQLQDRKTENPVQPAATTTGWLTGEYDVTGVLSQITDDDWARARDNAIEKGREQLMDKYTCVGGCEDGFCLLDVKVESDRAGRKIRRVIPNPPDSIPFQQGRREEEHSFLTYEVKVSAHCRCAKRSKPPVISSGGSEVLIGGPGGQPPPPKPDPPTFHWEPRLKWTPDLHWNLRLRWDWSPHFDLPFGYGYPPPFDHRYFVAPPCPTPEVAPGAKPDTEKPAEEDSG